MNHKRLEFTIDARTVAEIPYDDDVAHGRAPFVLTVPREKAADGKFTKLLGGIVGGGIVPIIRDVNFASLVVVDNTNHWTVTGKLHQNW